MTIVDRICAAGLTGVDAQQIATMIPQGCRSEPADVQALLLADGAIPSEVITTARRDDRDRLAELLFALRGRRTVPTNSLTSPWRILPDLRARPRPRRSSPIQA
jgi:hypothetical protein